MSPNWRAYLRNSLQHLRSLFFTNRVITVPWRHSFIFSIFLTTTVAYYRLWPQCRKKRWKYTFLVPKFYGSGIWAIVNKHSNIAPTSSCLPKFRDVPPSDLRRRTVRYRKYKINKNVEKNHSSKTWTVASLYRAATVNNKRLVMMGRWATAN